MAVALLTVTLVGAGPQPWQFIPAFVLAGAGLGCFAAPNTSVILDGVPPRSAGQASGLLATSQQVGGAVGVALVGIVFFGVLSSSAAAAARDQAPALRTQLSAAGLPAAAVGPAVQGFERCFVDRSASTDPSPSASPPSCQALAGSGGSAAAGTAFAQASTSALSSTFSQAIRWGLAYEVLVFLLAALLVLRLPRHTSAHEEDTASEQRAAAVG